MGKLSIKELDKSKTEQSISNEQARLDHCRLVLEKTKKEYDQKRYEYRCKLANLEDKITALETSISSGEQFVRECKDHLNDFENAEGN